MKWTIFFVILLLVFNKGNGQKHLFLKTSDENYQLNIASEEVNKIYIPAEYGESQLKSGIKKSKINVTFIDFPNNAETAFLYAASIWENLISSTIPINIIAKWEEMDDQVVSKSRPSLSFRTFEGAPVSDVYYPVSLVEKLTGQEMNEGEPDIFCSFNKNMPWYFNTNGNTPENKYDFVTAVLHEITHGIGFYGFFKDNNGEGFFNNASNLPSIYDYFIFNNLNQQISDKTIFNSPSKELHLQLTSEKLKLYKPRSISVNQEILDWIYAPQEWKEGVSIYHFNGDNNITQLMSAEIHKGEAIHNPDNITLNVLSDIGWKSVSFDFEDIKDIEQPLSLLPINIGITSDMEIDTSTVFLIFSKDNFNSNIQVPLSYNNVTHRFEGNIPLNFYQGNVKLYFQLQTKDNRLFKFPASAPDKIFSFRIGPDYYPPEIYHNPSKMMSKLSDGLILKAIASDNIGIKDLVVEYKINGVLQDPVEMHDESNNLYNLNLALSENINENTRLEYRLIAKDNSQLQNKSVNPQIGYYSVDIYETLPPVYNYTNNFNTANTDFSLSDFVVSRPVSFVNGNLHTIAPYYISEIDDEYYNHLALLKHPVILQENGLMEFDEIVLVEPGETGADYTNKYFWDYVIVEGSKNSGKTWHPLIDGYDSQINEGWSGEFKSSLINNTSVSAGTYNMFSKHSINLTSNPNFSAGDTVLFRFRLASDKTVNGWGWAIDNLNIQQSVTGIDEKFVENSFTIYPNPVNDILNIEFAENQSFNPEKTEIIITDLLGKKLMQIQPKGNLLKTTIKIDVSNLKKGLYLINFVNFQNGLISKKIIKN